MVGHGGLFLWVNVMKKKKASCKQKTMHIRSISICYLILREGDSQS